MCTARRWPAALVLGGLALIVTGAVAYADDPGADPFAALAAMPAEDLALLHGREGVSILWGEQHFEIESSNKLHADRVTSGHVDFGASFNGARGFTAMANNTGNNAIVTNGMIVNLNLH